MKVIHDLSGLSKEEIVAYLREVSTFIGLDPDLNALDTIWMRNENGPGQSLVVYARRGTAEILRNIKGIAIVDLTDHMVGGSIVFRAVGKDKNGRQEIATGSKSIAGLQGKQLDDAIMTASTRALRRVTMQFTTLGILDESEVVAVVGQEVNPAGSAQLAGSPMVIPPPQVPANNAPGKITEPTKAPFNDVGAAAARVADGPAQPAPVEKAAPGKITVPEEKNAVLAAAATGGPDVIKPHTVASYHVPTPDASLAQTSGPNFKEAEKVAPEAPAASGEQFLGRPEQVVAAWEQHAKEQAAKNAIREEDAKELEKDINAAESTPSTDAKPDIKPDAEAAEKAAKPKRARKPRGTVSLDGPEPEVVNKDPKAPENVYSPAEQSEAATAVMTADSAPTPDKFMQAKEVVQAVIKGEIPNPVAVPTQANPAVPTQANPVVPGMPAPEQMAEYRKKVSVITAELPAGVGMGSVQRMRAFITKRTGAAPQNMTLDQWTAFLSWLDAAVASSGVAGVIKAIEAELA